MNTEQFTKVFHRLEKVLKEWEQLDVAQRSVPFMFGAPEDSRKCATTRTMPASIFGAEFAEEVLGEWCELSLRPHDIRNQYRVDVKLFNRCSTIDLGESR